MAKKPAQPIPIFQSSGRGGGGGGSGSLAQAAIANFINDQSTAQKKMVDNFAKLQEAQAQGAAQAAGQVTQAMNQVVAREDERVAREESQQERMKDRDYQERFHEFTAKFKEQAAKDAAITNNRVSTQMAAGRDFIQRMDANRVEYGDRIKGMRMKLRDPDNIEAWANIPGGSDIMEKMNRNLRLAQLFHENDFQSDFTGPIANKMAEVQEQILRGDPHADLSKLMNMKPRNLMLQAAGKPTSDDWTPEEMEELYDSGGWVPGGLYGRDPDDPSLEKYRNVNPVDYMSIHWMLEDEDFFAVVQHKKFQDEYLEMRMEGFRDMREELQSQQEFKKRDYDRIEDTAIQSIFFGASKFMEDLGRGHTTLESLPSKLTLKSGEFGLNNGQDVMATGLLESVLLSLGGPGSEFKLKTLDALARGEGDGGVLDTAIELHKGFHLRNLLTHVENQLVQMQGIQSPASRKAGEKAGTPLSMRLAVQVMDMPKGEERDSLMRALLTVAPGMREKVKRTGILQRESEGAVLGQLHRGVNRLFNIAKQRAGQYRDLLEAQPALQTYQMKQGSSLRYHDALVASYMSDKQDQGLSHEEAQQQAAKQATQQQRQEALLSVEGDVTPDDFDIETETLQQTIKLSPFVAAGELTAQFSRYPEYIAALFSGDFENMPPPPSSPPEPDADLERNMQMYKRNRTKVEKEMQRRREAHAGKAPTSSTTVPIKGEPEGKKSDKPFF